MPLLDQLGQLGAALDRHGNVVYPVVAVLVVLMVVVALVRRLAEPNLSPEELWQVKKTALRLFEDEQQGFTCAAAAVRLSLSPRQLKMVLAELVQDRFLIAVSEGDQVVFKLKRLQGG